MALQVAVSLMEKVRRDQKSLTESNMRGFLSQCLGAANVKELRWICDCVSRALKDYESAELGEKFLRLPLVLVEHNFVCELRKGPALRSLRRVFLLCRLQRFIEDCLDDILSGTNHRCASFFHVLCSMFVAPLTPVIIP